MRRLWTEQTVTFDGTHHRVTGAGLAPLPVQRPIPVWIGAASRPALERAGRLADGWFPMTAPGPKLDEARDIVARSRDRGGQGPVVARDGRPHLLARRPTAGRRRARPVGRRRRHPRVGEHDGCRAAHRRRASVRAGRHRGESAGLKPAIPAVPPIGGTAVPPVHPPITGHTKRPWHGSLESSPEHTGARHQKSTETGKLK